MTDGKLAMNDSENKVHCSTCFGNNDCVLTCPCPCHHLKNALYPNIQGE